MATIKCPAPNCDIEWPADTQTDILTRLLDIHSATAHAAPARVPAPTPAVRAEKIRRPMVSAAGTSEGHTSSRGGQTTNKPSTSTILKLSFSYWNATMRSYAKISPEPMARLPPVHQDTGSVQRKRNGRQGKTTTDATRQRRASQSLRRAPQGVGRSLQLQHQMPVGAALTTATLWSVTRPSAVSMTKKSDLTSWANPDKTCHSKTHSAMWKQRKVARGRPATLLGTAQ